MHKRLLHVPVVYQRIKLCRQHKPEKEYGASLHHSYTLLLHQHTTELTRRMLVEQSDINKYHRYIPELHQHVPRHQQYTLAAQPGMHGPAIDMLTATLICRACAVILYLPHMPAF
ncbi:hypothetical protein HNQ91_002596 [Filimonas zeae]|uniref:hypothetical protein n=1 Tax=Filimonas zeae TaxID=1737353 RepID=UPI00166DB883|nr:hypothetical protein [Filimonas zeae]MDR6339545.1 hypothetical protein [Filimonas zeae]